MFPRQSGCPGETALPPAVVVHGLAQARVALAEGLPVTLLSGPGAGSYAGALWWREVVSQARAAYPDTPCQDVLDCADAPGHAMAAIRAGQAILVLDPACPAYARIATLARLLPARPSTLDLAARLAPGRLRTWLLGAREDDSAAPVR